MIQTTQESTHRCVAHARNDIRAGDDARDVIARRFAQIHASHTREAMHTHRHAAMRLSTSSRVDSSRPLRSRITSDSKSLSALCMSMVTHAATPPPRLCPVTMNSNPARSAIAAAAAGSIRFTTCHADTTMPPCAQPFKNLTLALLTSVSAS